MTRELPGIPTRDPHGIRAHLEPVQDIHVTHGMSARALVDALGAGSAFSAKKVAVAADIVRRMQRPGVTRILSFPAALCATGVRGVFVDMVREGMVDAIVTTCGTLDHDLARTWRDYYHGSFDLDDRALLKEEVNRLGNVLVPYESYGDVLEERLKPWLEEMFAQKKRWSTSDFCAELGHRLAREPHSERSLLRACAQKGVPIFVPGPTDGSVGSQVWARYQQDREVGFDLMADEQKLSDLTFAAKELGAIMIGGGISKHHVIWWSQFRGGLDHAVYVTTAVEHDGSLSGARLEEAISWGKVKEDARMVNVEGDAALILPLVMAAVKG
ncbi:MAG TPA: deoxyhypusine synthase [Candidatus Thermoplasmatota archaeon]|nr:deoxyhypusine synthase [Candidatus Thermoplasmatota archaeon]